MGNKENSNRDNPKLNIASDSLKLSLTQLIALSVSMISATLLSRYTTLEEYGTYSQIMLIVNLITTIFVLGLPNSINYFLGRYKENEEKQHFLSIYFTLSTLLGIIAGVSLVVFMPILKRFFNNELLSNFLFFFALFPWAKIILAGIEKVLISYNRTKLIMIYRILNSVFLLAIIPIAMIFKLGFLGYMILFLIVESIFALSVYFIVNKVSGEITPLLETGYIKEIFVFSIPIGLASIVGTLSTLLDKLIIGRFFTTEELAIYSNAAKELPVTIVAVSLTAIIMPRLISLLNKNKNKEAIKLWGESIMFSYIILAFFITVLFTFAPEIITILYSKKYLPGVKVFRIYSLVLILRFTYFGIILNSIGKTKFIFYSSIISLVFNFGLSIIFYYFIGFEGPAIATFISVLTVQIIQLVFTSKSVDIKFKNIMPWKEMFKITLLNILLGLLVYFIRIAFISGDGIFMLLKVIILGVFWMAVYYLIVRKRLKKHYDELNKEY